MSFAEQSIKEIFANKKDRNYVELKSYYSFLEAFTLSDTKCTGIRIPDTILIEHGGNIKCWIFNSKKDNEIPVLKKRPEKLNTNEIMTFFSKGKGLDTMRSGQGSGFFISKIAKIRDYNQPQAIVRYINDTLDLLNLTDLQDYLQTGLNYLKMIQTCLNIKSKSEYNSNETYYCEYRHDDSLLPPAFRFVKKVLQYSNPEQNISSSCYKSRLLFKASTKPFSETSSYADLQNAPGLSSAKENKTRTYLITENSQKFYRVFDTATNQRLEKLTRLFATYLSQAFKITIKKLVCKFAVDDSHEFYLMGVKELLVEFKDKGKFPHYEYL